MKPEKSRTPVGITLLLIGIYIIVILLLFWFNILKVKDLVQISTVALGWLIALLIAIIHLNRARKDSQEAKEYEIKKKLEIEAYKEVNKSINDFSGTINSVLTLFFTSLDSKLKLHFQFPKFIPFDRIQIDQEIAMTRINLYNGNTKFLLAIEANEIAIIEYDFYRKYINFETDENKREQIETGYLFEEKHFGDLKYRADKSLIQDIKKVREALIASGLDGEKVKYAHALIGRSIFVRYLEDREILIREYFHQVAN